MRVEWWASALADIDAIREYAETNQLPAPDALIRRLGRRADNLAVFPHSGRVVPEWNQPFLREVAIGSFRMVYMVGPELVAIVAVIHGAREIFEPPED